MNETELLELGTALARTSDVLRPGTRAPFRDYLRMVLANHGGEIDDLFGGSVYLVSVDGQAVDGPDSTVLVTATSRVVLYRRARTGRAHPGRGPADLVELSTVWRRRDARSDDERV